ncbi:hypothetical protein ACFQZE_15555 [Paenibacillus sp. GCM10027627]
MMNDVMISLSIWRSARGEMSCSTYSWRRVELGAADRKLRNRQQKHKQKTENGEFHMSNTTLKTKETKHDGLDSKQLITVSTEELKKDELIGVLAGLIKNYVNKKQQQ